MADKKASNADAKLEHSVEGVTTRDDVTDMGVPMLAGDPAEPVGPEDAFGPGPKRGDYSKRLGDSYYNPHHVEAVPMSERKEGEPIVRVVAQAPRASEQGEQARLKGGVDSR